MVTLEYAREIKKKYLEWLDSFDNVHLIMTTIVNGEPTIVIYAIAPVPEIPAELEGVPVKIEIRRVQQTLSVEKREWKWRPIQGGVSVGSAPAGIQPGAYGTLGLVLRKDNRTYIMSNHHVLMGVGDVLYQPPNSIDPDLEYAVGTVVGSIPYSASDNFVDLAWAEIPNPFFATDSILGIASQDDWWLLEDNKTEPEIGEFAMKSGVTTGVTTGKVIDTSATTWLDTNYDGWGDYRFTDVIVVETIDTPFALGGDSGSAVIKEDGTFIGLLFGSDSNTTVVCKTKNIIPQIGTGFSFRGFSFQKIPVPEPPSVLMASFTYKPNSGTPPLTVQFNNTSTGVMLSVYWDFGDGTSSYQLNPKHTYNSEGSYTPRLQIVGPEGNSEAWSTNPIFVYSANGRLIVNASPEGALITVVSVSSGATVKTAYNYCDFYTNEGYYDINVTLSGFTPYNSRVYIASGGMLQIDVPLDQITQNGTLIVNAQPNGAHIVVTNSGNQVVVNSYTSATQQLPPDNYTLTVSLLNYISQSENFSLALGETKTFNIALLPTPDIDPPIAFFSTDFQTGLAPLTVHFTNKSTGDITSYAWDFGDGGLSQEQNPIHIYNVPASYTAKLTVTGPGGASIKTLTIKVTQTSPKNNNLYYAGALALVGLILISDKGK